MTGEMSASEVTKENYPDLFDLKDLFEKEGIKCEARSFDQYQGPYLKCDFRGIQFKIWYCNEHPDSFILKHSPVGEEYFFEFPLGYPTEMIKEHLQKTHCTNYISSLEDKYLAILSDTFNNDIGKFEQWLSQGELKGFDGKPTLEEEISLFIINIIPKAYTPEYWERIEDEIASILKEKGLSGHIKSIPTGNSTSF